MNKTNASFLKGNVSIRKQRQTHNEYDATAHSKFWNLQKLINNPLTVPNAPTMLDMKRNKEIKQNKKPTD